MKRRLQEDSFMLSAAGLKRVLAGQGAGGVSAGAEEHRLPAEHERLGGSSGEDAVDQVG